MPTSIIYCSHLQTVGFIFLGQGRLVSRPKQSPYHPAIRKCLLGVLRELYSKFGDYQAIFTTLSATQRLLISQPPLFSKEKLQRMEFFRKKKKSPKSPDKDCSPLWPTPCLSQGRERESAYHSMLQSPRKCLALLASSPPLFGELR